MAAKAAAEEAAVADAAEAAKQAAAAKEQQRAAEEQAKAETAAAKAATLRLAKETAATAAKADEAGRYPTVAQLLAKTELKQCVLPAAGSPQCSSASKACRQSTPRSARCYFVQRMLTQSRLLADGRLCAARGPCRSSCRAALRLLLCRASVAGMQVRRAVCVCRD